MTEWKYQPPSQQTMKQRSEQKPGGGWKGKGYLHNELYKAYAPRDGQNKLRIIPPLEVGKLEWYGLDVFIHRNIGLNKDIYLCLKSMRLGERCPVDELQTKELWDEDPDLAKTYYPERRCLIWVLDLLLEDPFKEIMLWSAAAGTIYDVHNVAQDPETGRFIDIMDPKTGLAINFKKEGKGKMTKYSAIQIGRTPVPLTDSVLAQRLPYADLLIVPTYDEVKEAMSFSATAAWKEEGSTDSGAQDAATKTGKYESEVEAEAEEPSGTKLDSMTRDQLKAFKVQNKGEIKELNFTIQAKWSDEELKNQIMAALAAANRMDLVVAEVEAEEEVATQDNRSAAPASEQGSSAIDKKREEVRARLAAAMAAGSKK